MLNSIGILTSGGDSPGMNATIRAVVRTCIYEGVHVWGIYNGYRGLLDEEMVEMTSRSVGDIIQRGGTILGTARCRRFMTPEGRQQAFENMKKRGIEGLVIIGGDGSLTGASKFSQETGVPIVGLPGTIDNDVWGTDYTIGCDTAVNTVVDAINKLRDSASSHNRIAVIEVMGRHCGWMPLVSGIAGGAQYILIPEEDYDMDAVCNGIVKSFENGRRYSLVIVAEGVGSAIDFGKIIEEKTGIDVRVSVLGHIQRGGSPTVIDRVKASQLGEKAALAIINGQSDVVFGFDKGRVVGINLYDAVNNKKPLDPEYLRMASYLVR